MRDYEEEKLVKLKVWSHRKKNPNKLERYKLEKGNSRQHGGSWYERRPYRPPVPNVLPKSATDKVGSGC
jgi:hypothetical protein